ncbi:class I SAM-dependent methyltransferase [Caenimonas aquaedulcis]|uniref:Methyltransferase domain-containing protein n=1 Tax=Caenimonas aquaedulcis TaxID=2793270 RepID=A0A931H1M6_9BURK|nr:methyltransferase domain-containing protein [Caenimonas aquaedulcis]MBG9386893.1 methyltransferase domain-containing protein [Caenimonas aquaedulcis]
MPSATLPAPSAPGYQVKFETIAGTGDDLKLRSLLDRQQFHDPLGEAERAGVPPAQWPLFGMLWPSGRVLAHAMQTFELDGLRVLEVGCGLGLASLVVHRRGGDVTASDCHPLAAAFLAENLRLNGLAPMKYLRGDWTGQNPGLGRFDLIIGSDVLYDREHPVSLSHFIDRHSAMSVEVVIADPGRGNQSRFGRSMATLGYSHSEQPIRSLPGGGAYKGKLHSWRRSAFS